MPQRLLESCALGFGGSAGMAEGHKGQATQALNVRGRSSRVQEPEPQAKNRLVFAARGGANAGAGGRGAGGRTWRCWNGPRLPVCSSGWEEIERAGGGGASVSSLGLRRLTGCTCYPGRTWLCISCFVPQMSSSKGLVQTSNRDERVSPHVCLPPHQTHRMGQAP